ncbi:hypothetical protein Q7P35_001750 [Cladosporium inversicolor]
MRSGGVEESTAAWAAGEIGAALSCFACSLTQTQRDRQDSSGQARSGRLAGVMGVVTGRAGAAKRDAAKGGVASTSTSTSTRTEQQHRQPTLLTDDNDHDHDCSHAKARCASQHVRQACVYHDAARLRYGNNYYKHVATMGSLDPSSPLHKRADV